MIRTQRASASRCAGSNPVRDVDYAGGVGDQVMLTSSGRRRQSGTELARERFHGVPTSDNVDEPFCERLLLSGGQRGLVFDRVGNPAQEVGVSHHIAEPGWKLRNRESEGAGYPLQDFRLVGEITV